MKISIYDVSKINTTISQANTIEVVKPANVPYQSWNYRVATSNEKKETN